MKKKQLLCFMIDNKFHHKFVNFEEENIFEISREQIKKLINDLTNINKQVQLLVYINQELDDSIYYINFNNKPIGPYTSSINSNDALVKYPTFADKVLHYLKDDNTSGGFVIDTIDKVISKCGQIIDDSNIYNNLEDEDEQETFISETISNTLSDFGLGDNEDHYDNVFNVISQIYLTAYMDEDEDEDVYMEAANNMDKFMPDETELMEEFYQITDNDTMQEFLETYCDEESLIRYLPEGTSEGFAEYLANINVENL